MHNRGIGLSAHASHRVGRRSIGQVSSASEAFHAGIAGHAEAFLRDLCGYGEVYLHSPPSTGSKHVQANGQIPLGIFSNGFDQLAALDQHLVGIVEQ